MKSVSGRKAAEVRTKSNRQGRIRRPSEVTKQGQEDRKTRRLTEYAALGEKDRIMTRNVAHIGNKAGAAPKIGKAKKGAQA